MPKLSAVPPSAPPSSEKLRQRIKAMPKPAAMLECRCGSREFIELKSGVEYVDGKARGGTKALACANCWRNGERVIIA